MNEKYSQLLERKRHAYDNSGFNPVFMPDMLFDFQKSLIEWAIVKGRSAIFADCGLGKSAMEMTYAENVARKTNGRVLILTPLAVSLQMVDEGEKFGIESARSADGKFPQTAKIVVTNYERLHYFNPADFVACVADESSILKNCDGVTRAAVTDFMRKMSFRLLCTATPSPNDLIELGTSSEALGYMGFNDMLSTFFKKDQDRKTHSRKDEFRSGVWRFRGHAESHFFHWVCSWARACRKPSDLGFADDKFHLPPLHTRETVVDCNEPLDGMLFSMPAVGLSEQRQERRRTLEIRCEAASERINAHKSPAVAWCYLNDESKALKNAIPDAVEVSGSDSMEAKEEAFIAFAKGSIRVLVTKPEIAGFGLNWQHCAHQTFFPSHSFEQFHQAIRRSWRFGQTKPVIVDIITSEGERGVLANLMRKSEQAEKLFTNLVSLMGEANTFKQETRNNTQQKLPQWLSTTK
jgi:SNF2 family DNA or RNA helicase